MKRRRLSKKFKRLIIIESAVLFFIFCFILYCQLVIDMNTFKDPVVFALSFMLPLIVFAIPSGIGYMLKGMIFVGDYENPMIFEDGQKTISPSDSNFLSANLNI